MKCQSQMFVRNSNNKVKDDLSAGGAQYINSYASFDYNSSPVNRQSCSLSEFSQPIYPNLHIFSYFISIKITDRHDRQLSHLFCWKVVLCLVTIACVVCTLLYPKNKCRKSCKQHSIAEILKMIFYIIFYICYSKVCVYWFYKHFKCGSSVELKLSIDMLHIPKRPVHL